VIPPNST